MNTSNPVAYEHEVPDILIALRRVHETIIAHGLDPRVHHLAQLRASQMNQCGFCVKMHTEEARADGETSERLDRVVVWRSVDDFSAAEKAALAWTEALTALDGQADLGVLRGDLRPHFSDKEIGVITMTAAMINLWNRIGVSRH